ncbi:hypothetical protein JXB41_01825 [Candidatus Woesearchaeota archaeon]|nr:hypothetical protein [Candidatus Woesearchaeota archaeon]
MATAAAILYSVQRLIVKMNPKIKKGIICFILIVLFVFIIPDSLASGLGISPSSVNFKEVRKGGYAEASVFLSTTSNENIYVMPEYYGEIKDWLNVSDEIILNSSAVKEVVVSIKPPEDIMNGIYEGKVSFMASPGKNEAYIGSSLIATVSLKIKIEIIGEEIIKCNVGAVEIEPMEEDSNIILHADVKNEGNVRIKPEFNLDVWKGNELIFSEDFNVNEEVLPTQTKRVSYEIEVHDLEKGDYLGEILAKTCGVEKDVLFRVQEKGSITDEGELLRIEVNNNTLKEKEILPVKAVFKNTGKRTVTARFKGEVYSNNRIIDVIESDSYYVYPGETTEIETFYQANVTGSYEIRGKILYNKKESYGQSAYIEVTEKESSYGSMVKYFIFGLIGLIIIVLTLLIITKKK